ncbi:MAG: transcription initiation protein [Nocardioides sp.]|nr:transcription initiation protein [Nocardioides sp.]
MTTYALLLPGDEAWWETETGQAEGMPRHERFSALLAERGHTITGGAELMPSAQARTVRPAPDGSAEPGSGVVTDGPYAESVEQMGGFYLVETDDLDDLLAVCAVLACPGHSVEVREVVVR